MFCNHGSPGFHMTFANGITVSVQWSIRHYRTGRDLDPRGVPDSENRISPNAEIAAWDRDGNYLSIDALYEGDGRLKIADNGVLSVGWQNAENVARILNNASKL